ncbi:Lectin receptor kinase [Quillaja saponaria]|uniref:non-specific serine/threonine protein kinase n=1 Tax=Quillaja saponaria TaxID=32244 RepID=A0AAD7VCX7_QUISA|nr:Lectin receptor kinase [Quillaja saponaria]
MKRLSPFFILLLDFNSCKGDHILSDTHHFNMFIFNNSLYFPKFVKFLLLATSIFGSACVTQVGCLNFSYPAFHRKSGEDLHLSKNSGIYNDAIQITPDTAGDIGLLSNMSGRVFHNEQLKLWDNQRNTKASFNSTFVFNIFPPDSPWGEGLAFLLTSNTSLPDNSDGQWLGIVNATSIGVSNVVAVEFDTRKSYPEDIDDNHVGVDVKSIYSIQQEPLGGHGVNLSSGVDITASVLFDAKSERMTIFVSKSGATEQKLKTPVLSVDLELSKLLPEDVFVGFSASTGEYAQLNAIRSWDFSSWEYIERDPINLTWLWVLIPIFVVGLLSGIAFIYYWKRKHRKDQGLDDDLQLELEIKTSSTAPHKFKLKELISATQNFNSLNKLGKGGFGTVYKGTLKNKDVAVKRISKDSRHGKQDFIAEITTIGNLNHKNLVKLIGWCYERTELLLVYECMPNGSLDKYIFCSGSPAAEDLNLSWERRHSIICGVARALDYLHNGCDKRVLHRDIKASNIMLDSDFNARLGDFGLARTILFSENTHHSTKEIAGTPGYMAPESFHTGRASVETDVYAFGVLILEVACGRKPGRPNVLNNYNNSIIDWVWELHRRESIIEVLDMRLNCTFNKDRAICMLKLGLACCHPNPYERPSMKTALLVLTGEAAPPIIPSEKPAFMWPALVPSLKEELNCRQSESLLTPITELISGR